MKSLFESLTGAFIECALLLVVVCYKWEGCDLLCKIEWTQRVHMWLHTDHETTARCKWLLQSMELFLYPSITDSQYVIVFDSLVQYNSNGQCAPS